MVKNHSEASFETKSIFGLNRNKLIRGTALGLAGAAFLGAACSTETTVGFKNDRGEVIYEQSVDDVLDGTVNSVEEFKKGSEYTKEERLYIDPKDYQTFDESLRVEDQADYLYEGFENTYEDILNDPSFPPTGEEKAVFYMPDLHKPRSEWTGQDYANYYSMGIFYATKQDNENVALRAATVVSRPGTNTYGNLREWIKNDDTAGRGLKSIYRAVSTPLDGKVLKPATIGNVVIDENGGALVGLESLTDGNINYTIFVNRSDSHGHILSIEAKTVDTLEDQVITQLIAQNS